MKEINSESILQRNSKQLFSEVDGEVVMLSINNGEYYSLDSISTQIWTLLAKPCTFQNLVDNLMKMYEVSKEMCVNDTKQLLEEFIRKGLVKIIDE